MEDLVTVFRSADENAREDATAIAEMLRDAGISATLLDDDAPGVPEGVWQVSVPAGDSARAEQMIATRTAADEELEKPDQSHDLDLVTVFEAGEGATESEAEALTVKGLLEANGIFAVVTGMEVPIPSLGWKVQVRKDKEAEAQRVISEAQAAGPEAADQAEAETEI